MPARALDEGVSPSPAGMTTPALSRRSTPAPRRRWPCSGCMPHVRSSRLRFSFERCHAGVASGNINGVEQYRRTGEKTTIRLDLVTVRPRSELRVAVRLSGRAPRRSSTPAFMSRRCVVKAIRQKDGDFACLDRVSGKFGYCRSAQRRGRMLCSARLGWTFLGSTSAGTLMFSGFSSLPAPGPPSPSATLASPVNLGQHSQHAFTNRRRLHFSQFKTQRGQCDSSRALTGCYRRA